MLGLLFIYFIGKQFYQLAEKFDKNKWLFAILGIVAYYAGTFLTGAIIGVLVVVFSLDVDLENTTGLGLLTIPFGIGVTFLFYKILKPNWEEEYQRKLIIERNKAEAFGVNVSTAKVEEEEENFRK